MTYHQSFDRLGNRLLQDQPGWQHRVVWWGAGITIACCVAIMLWGR